MGDARTRPYLVAGNWKMNLTRESAQKLAAAIAAAAPRDESGVEVLVCPPFPYLECVANVLRGSGVRLGAQNMYHEPPGAFTGEVAAEMLVDLGCRYVLVGHSERRHILGETDQQINRKVAAALAKGLKVVLCVGELLSEREAGKTESVLDTQIETGLAGVDAAAMKNVVIAYEPVWAIGTGVVATTEQAESAHRHLRNRLADCYNSGTAAQTRILYGGSVKADNAAALLEQPDIDGALVGGASLKSDSFVPIIEAARNLI
jgi:triosephosphate isomerase